MAEPPYRPGEAPGCDVVRFPLTVDFDQDVRNHRCCWCTGAEGWTVCHRAGHAEAVATSAASGS